MCLLPPSSVLITIDGQRQAGAFVLRPNEHFDYKDERFVFKSATQVPITVASGRCKFCQTPLTVAAILWLAADSPLQGAKLCTACAKAFATSPR
ncbi:hypothetical protein TI05_16380 [Achromatium sp. WMS3]|nr:hypothetical protein TI05_16380 [Achromatium sp. WMS3]